MITSGGNPLKKTVKVTLDEQENALVSWNGDAVDVSRYANAIIVADVTLFDTTTGDERMILELEGSCDGVLWDHLATFVDEENAGDVATVTGDADRGKIEAVGQYAVPMYHEMPLYLRTVATLSGTTPIVTLTVTGSFR